MDSTAADVEATTALYDLVSKILGLFMKTFFGCSYKPDTNCSPIGLIVEAAVFVVVFVPVLYVELILINYCLQSSDVEGQVMRKFRQDFLDSVRQVEAGIKGKCTIRHWGMATEEKDVEQANILCRSSIPFPSSLQLLNGCGKKYSDAIFHVQLQQDSGMLRIMDPKNKAAAGFKALQEFSTLSLQMSPCREGGWSLQGTRISETVVFKIGQGHIAPSEPGSNEYEAYWVETLMKIDHMDTVAGNNETPEHEQKECNYIFQRESYPHELLVVGKFKKTSGSNCFEGEWMLSTCALRGHFDIFEPPSTSVNDFVTAQNVKGLLR